MRARANVAALCGLTIASLLMAELPVRAAAANFVSATRRFPSKAAYTTFLDERVAML